MGAKVDRNDITANVMRAALILAAREKPLTRWRDLKQSERTEYVKQGRRILESIAKHQPECWHDEA